MRSVMAIVLGLAVIIAVTTIGTMLPTKPLMGGDQTVQPTMTYLAANLFLGFLGAVLGGYLAAMVGREKPMLAVGALAGLLVVMSIVAALATDKQTQEADQPAWYPYVIAPIGIGGVLLGGLMRRGAG